MQKPKISRKTAKTLGLKRYIDEPCKRGHSERYTSSGLCVECSLEATRKWYEKNKERTSIVCKKWREKNADKVRVYDSRPRNTPERKAYNAASAARRRGADGSFTVEDIVRIRKEQENLCVICKIDLDLAKVEVDHIVPLVLGGSNWPENLQLLCQACNRRKGAKVAA